MYAEHDGRPGSQSDRMLVSSKNLDQILKKGANKLTDPLTRPAFTSCASKSCRAAEKRVHPAV